MVNQTGKYRDIAHSIYNLDCSIPKEISVAFHNGSNYDYHFIMKQLAKESNGKRNCLGENTEKYKIFSVSITKEVKRIDENREELVKITYKLLFIDLWQAHYRLLLIILLKEFIKLNVNMDMIIKKCKMCEIKDKNYKCCLKYTNIKNDLMFLLQ